MADMVGGLAASVTMDDSTLDAGLGKLRSAIEATRNHISSLSSQLASGTIDTDKFASELGKAEGQLRKLQSAEKSLEVAQRERAQAARDASGATANEAAAAALAADTAQRLAAAHAAEATATAAATAAEKAREQALLSTLVPLAQLQVAGFKYSDSLEKIAASQAAQKTAADLAQAAAAAKATEDALTANLIPLVNLQMAGLKYKDILEDAARAQMAAQSPVGPVNMSPAGQKFAQSGGGMGGVNKGLEDTGRLAAIARHRLMSIGNTLDDLQYVGEMGLRPIINNIMQISPAVGIALIAFDQLRKHGDALESVAVAVGEHWLGSFDKATGGARTFIDTIKSIRGVIGEASKWVAELGEGWNALTKKREREQAATIKDFEGEGSTGDKETGKNVTKAIDAYGPKKFIDEAIEKEKKISPDLRRGGEVEREARAKLIELYNQAEKGDTNAIAALQRRTEGTGVGRAIRAAANPRGKGEIAEEKKAAEEAEREQKIADEAREDAIKGAVSALQKQFSRGAAQGRKYTEQDVAAAIGRAGLATAPDMLGPTLSGLQKNFEGDIARRAAEKGITPEQARKDFLEDEARDDKSERDKKNKPQKDLEEKMRKNVKDFLKDDEEMRDREEKDWDLKRQYNKLVNPNVEGKSLGLDEYESSIKSQSGDDKLERRMAEAVEVLKKIRENNEKYQVIARKPR